MRVIRGAALSVRFGLEMCLVAAMGVIAWETASPGWRWPLAALAIVVVLVIWGLFLSPKAAATLFVVVWAVDRAILAITAP
ncbi:DUF2568 domain-containing protein [Citricoccus sp. NR2]|uniref:DUF2568 domain-containing protein n=1 Tax=Citricoccus sp. NR2 TaxID=3004095 RepID=UPI0022DD17F6|nr:DUF2568 domain-containing protein [Citricoccus sp. NR2]WBL19851.1 DUF2568 domain-containing protein [Citricoccus sp. NR2]